MFAETCERFPLLTMTTVAHICALRLILNLEALFGATLRLSVVLALTSSLNPVCASQP